jgi:cardiolipin synthase
MLKFLSTHATEIISVFWTVAATLTTFHIVLYKREVRSAIGWIGLSWLAPIIGPVFYLIFGINRIARRAESLRKDLKEYEAPPSVEPLPASDVESELHDDRYHLGALAHLVGRVVNRPLVPGNHVEPLFNGDEAYPEMLDAIEGATESVTLATYIFDNDAWGDRFVNALADAHERGVEVRVLVDAAGLRYSFPSVYRKLKKRDVNVAKFLPSLLPPHLMTVNLRNHRKTLVVDGHTGFTGGINIREGHVIGDEPDDPIRDLHFKVTGPVVAHLQEIFVDDWNFSTDEDLRGEAFFPDIEPTGQVIARGIPDGPDEDLEKLPWTLHGALACAQDHVQIVTPYFLPDESLTAALNTAALRGVDVDIILPEKSNLPFVHWATFGQLRPVLERGCRVWLTPPPFDHSKLMVVDGSWTLLGSANWDPRSLRLNFEFNVECYDRDFSGRMADWISEKRERSRRLTLTEYDARGFGEKLRDNIFRLAAPYL